jgi:hypothetical protein
LAAAIASMISGWIVEALSEANPRRALTGRD